MSICLSALVLFSIIFMVVSLCPDVYALNLSGMVSLEAVDMTGQNSYVQRFDSGQSTLKWPIDVKALGFRLGLAQDNLCEAELGIIAGPWESTSTPMKDYDYINESLYDKPPHNGVDIYSESKLDSKVLVLDMNTRVFPLRNRFFSAGLTAGYRYEKYDYKAYDVHQIGYGPWQNQTSTTNGLVSLYTVDYDIFSVGLAIRTAIEDTFILTAEACSLPLVYANDEDNHLKRYRRSTSSTSGSGYQASLSGLYKIHQNWFISSGCTYSTITTHGHQNQYWYGDDPATTNNDTGTSINGLPLKIEQTNIRFSLGASRRF